MLRINIQLSMTGLDRTATVETTGLNDNHV